MKVVSFTRSFSFYVVVAPERILIIVICITFEFGAYLGLYKSAEAGVVYFNDEAFKRIFWWDEEQECSKSKVNIYA